jgi:hypothetical protein
MVSPEYLPPSEDLLLKQEEKKSLSTGKIVVMSVVATFLVAALAVSLFLSYKSGGVNNIKRICDPGGTRISVQDSTLSIDSSREFGAEDFRVIECALVQTSAPVSVLMRIQQTKASDGVQEARWGSYEASWVFVPYGGIDIVIKKH